MARENIARCNGCQAVIPEPTPGAGEWQGQPVEIRFGAIAVDLDLCEDCLQKPWTLPELKAIGTTRFGGAVEGVAQLAFLPMRD